MTKRRIYRSILSCVFLAAAAAALGAQQEGAQNPYQGVSTPPPDDSIQTTVEDSGAQSAKPSAGRPMTAPHVAGSPVTAEQQWREAQRHDPEDASSGDDGIVRVVPERLPERPAQPGLNRREFENDPDGDIVHPTLRPGELAEGTTIRVRLLSRLSTVDTPRGELFRTRVASDVVQGGQVLIPAGAEIEGHVEQVSSGTLGGSGSMNLRPETVILPDGSRFRLYAQLTSAPGSHTRIRGEGAVLPDSRIKRDGIEYGGTMGAGLIAGASLGGPAGALAGAAVGAGVITVHLLVSHPQATLDVGTALVFSLTEPLNLQPAAGGN
ncbi:hypothetical protein ACOBR2_12420 [Telmatobacter bradus]|uniref:hypothetical protein n=1 Tax=Telmatobacter bradus TaxID=474953 RepID=UPI003B4313BA